MKAARILLNVFMGLAVMAIVAMAQRATSVVKVTTDGVHRYVTSNGIPNHATGVFPNAHNPNSIAPQLYSFRMPLHPQIANTPTQLHPDTISGIAVNGVPFDPATAEWWDDDPRSGWRYEALTGGRDLGIDDSHAHVQPGGAYHYHGAPTSLIATLGSEAQIGWMADGFPIYAAARMKSSWRVKSGSRPAGSPGGKYDGTFDRDWEYVAGLGDLDACNGRLEKNPDGSASYQYFITDTFPYIPRCVVGTLDPSFRKLPPPFE